MFSRYIRPNAVRVGTSGAPSNTRVGAFKNTDGSIVVVMINTGSGSQSVSLGGLSASSATAYYMDNSVSSPSTLSSTVSSGNVEATLPGYSVVTFVVSTGSTGLQSTTKVTSPTSTSSQIGSQTGVAQHYGQCGGEGWTGLTTCASPYTCQFQNPYYSQCL